jgi:low temperature requirement protein LtrA
MVLLKERERNVAANSNARFQSSPVTKALTDFVAHPTWAGAAQALVLYLAVYAAWAYTTWAVTLVPAENPRTRRMLLVVMLLGLFMNAAIPRAFEDAG